jgi:hypothetical protein
MRRSQAPARPRSKNYCLKTFAVCYHNAIKKHRVEKGKDNHISEKAKIKYPYSAKEERAREKEKCREGVAKNRTRTCR